MTKPNTTNIAFVLDRSGSMRSIASDTIGGFNQFVEDQKKVTSDETKVSLFQFDDQYEVVFDNKPLAEVPALTDKTFIPRGNTALLDAIGRSIVSLGAAFAALPEDQRPSMVIMVIMTDGAENCSKEYTRAQVFSMIEHQTTAYNWQFMFLGANQNAIAEAAKIGILGANSMTYASTAASVDSSYKSLSRNVGKARMSRQVQDIAFTPDQRDDAMKPSGSKP